MNRYPLVSGCFLAGLVVAGCTSAGTAVNTKPATTSPSTNAPVNSPPQKPTAARVGATITIKGEQSGDSMDVTLVKVAATTKSIDGFSTPAAGHRYYALQYRLTNRGHVGYEDTPSNGAVVSDSQGQQFNATIVVGIAAGPMFPADVKLTPGNSALGWIVFEVPSAARITTAQFSLSSGFGNAGQWQIP